MGIALGTQQQSWTGTRLCVLQAGTQARNVALSHVKAGHNLQESVGGGGALTCVCVCAWGDGAHSDQT